MTHQEILKLYGLKGTVLGMMTSMKCELRANHDLRADFPERHHQRWLDGRDTVAVNSLRSLNRLRRQLCQVIKEVESEETTPQVV